MRLLRHNGCLSRQAYVEFNLEGIFSCESFSEFALLWLVLHHSRLHLDGEPPEKCWLEQWSRASANASVADLDTVAQNVTKAIEILGQGFIGANPVLNRKLTEGLIPNQDYFRQLLRLAYRMIFLPVLEERKLLHKASTPDTIECYYNYWSMSRLVRLSTKIRGPRHHDLWEGLKA